MKPGLFGQRSLHLVLFHLLLFLCHGVAANTEIINFSPSRGPPVDLPFDVVGNWSTLHPSDNERRWTLDPAMLHTPLREVCERDDDARPPFSCPHELWLFLDLDDAKWASHSTFTLRLSWPASIPADFAITIYSPRELLARLSSGRDLTSTRLERPSSSSSSSSSAPRTPATRSRYARIRAVDAGVPTPSIGLLGEHECDPAGVARAGREHPTVPFLVILEPVYLGVLPATLVPTVALLVPLVLVAASFVPWVTAYLEPFVRQAREDSKMRTLKER